MHHLRLLLVVGLLALVLAPHPAFAAPAPPVYTHAGRIVAGPFYAYFARHGGAAFFGEPLTDAYREPETGLQVQLFTYARMELHGATVLLSRLGSAYAAASGADPAFAWRTREATPPSYTFFPESGHALGGAFGWYHAQHGGTAFLGYPISEEFYEVQPDGTATLVQYFERAVLRYTPAGEGHGGSVDRLPLGALAALTLPATLRATPPPLLPLATVQITYPAGTADGVNIERAAQRLHGAAVAPDAELSFLNAVGPITAAAGYRPGSAIVGGRIVSNSVGGGICTVSTLLYRAAWAAGLPIVERRAHRYALRAYADTPGHDAAVYAPNQDLRIANPTGETLFLSVAAAHGRANLTIWGRGDGRSVQLAPPKISADGLIIRRTRIIRFSNGSTHRETATTRYVLLPTAQPHVSGSTELWVGATGPF